jgi:hypothetical protein
LTIVLTGLFLLLPSLGTGLALDDLLQQGRAQGIDEGHGDVDVGGGDGGPLDLFTFATGDPANNLRQIDAGRLLPWWSDLALKVSFFRPLSSLTHVLDARLWPRSPALMHLHSLAWYALLLVLAYRLYASLNGTHAIALLALALYAFDDTHGATMAWLANRNAVLTTLLGVAALWAHHRACTPSPGRRPAKLLAPLLLALGLLAGEAAIATLGYLAAHVAFIDRRPWKARLVSVAPAGIVALAWQIAYRALGYGAKHSGLYHDPAQLREFLPALAGNILALLGGQVGVVPADLLVWGSPWVGALVRASGALALAALVAVSLPVLRRRAAARFWAAGALLAALPISASIPGDRLLLFVGVGAMGFLAELFAWHLGPGGARIHPRRGRPWMQRAGTIVVAGLLVRRTVVALVLLPLRTHSLDVLAAPADAADAAVWRFGAGADTVVFVDAPLSAAVGYLAPRWALERRPHPPLVRWLAEGRTTLVITRPADNVLRVAPAGGFLQTDSERLYRASDRPLRVGDTTRLTGMTALVVSSTADGRPAVVDFAFAGPLEATGRLWLTWHGTGYERFKPPARGQTVILPPVNLADLGRARVLDGDGGLENEHGNSGILLAKGKTP